MPEPVHSARDSGISVLRIATRGSQLALWQAEWVKQHILEKHPGVTVELVVLKTTGDRVLDRPLSEVGGKGLFVKELETAILENRADLAVHSMKDVPGQLPAGLEISVIAKRENPADALVSRDGHSLDSLPDNSLVGTSSLRRGAQIKQLRPDLNIRSLRGNVPTRLRKLDEGEVDAAVLAVAGLKRLKLEDRISEILSVERMLPAIGQGVIGIETRVGDRATSDLLAHLDDPETRDCVCAERQVLIDLEGNCRLPIAGYCTLAGNYLHLRALLASPDGSLMIRESGQATRNSARELGGLVAEQVLKNGGREMQNSL